MRWDLFCRVIDNHGDVGVCWRLAADLAARGERVRLWIDEPAALAWMAPGLAPGVELCPWPAGPAVAPPGDVVVEAFGCELPAVWLAGMAKAKPAPVWINLEYLSAESYVERSHALRSPQLSGLAQGLDKWFFYPGFSAATGGLLREPGLVERINAFDRRAWLASRGWLPAPGQRVVSLFCYEQAPVADCCALLASTATLLLLPPGPARATVRAWQAAQAGAAALQVIELPWLPQAEYDHLLWACDLNFVRGEDSFVRAQWAAAPFVWQIYPQHDGVHAAKLDAFLQRFLAGADAELARRIEALTKAWNSLAPWPANWPEPAAWRRHGLAWRQHLLEQADLTTQLLAFCRSRRSLSC